MINADGSGSRLRRMRVFWLGMHHVLKPTELRRLRDLGYEVFAPAYISPVFDQSADTRVDRDQPTTLPVEAFDALLAHDFFYTSVPPRIAEILNSFFDCVIVTIHADWLASIISCYQGRVIYRIYGQPWSLSEQIIHNGLWKKLVDRPDFFIVPFAAESVEKEQPWFLERCSHFAPYQIPDDTFARSRTWGTGRFRDEIAVSIPNIQDPYYAKVYDDFAVFDEAYFRIYGPQRQTPADPRILGKLERAFFLRRFAETAGYFYPYRDDVCYLPPIEMMEVGGPVVYLGGSLLARFGDKTSPALAGDPEDAKARLSRLLAGDRGFSDEIIAAQEPIRRRYDRDHVGPIFDRVFTELLDQPPPPAGTAPSAVTRRDTIPAGTIVMPLHHNGLLSYIGGRPTAVEGIPRVVDVLVDTILGIGDAHILVTCFAEAEPVTRDFFRKHLRSGRLSVHVIGIGQEQEEAGRSLGRLEFINLVNRSGNNVDLVIIPHYYLFPECILLSRPTMLYLPDYFPHIMPEMVFDVSREKDSLNKQVGVRLARQAKYILTNSQFTKNYLPAAGFVEAAETDKVIVAPLPLLGHSRADVLDHWEAEQLRRRIGEGPFLFYPTANRPNKQLAFLLRLLAHMRLGVPELKLVLTCDLDSVPGVRETAVAYELLDCIILLPGCSDSRMRWLYEHAAALCLTSTAEGNMPPQILEAIKYGTPVVTTRLPTIVEIARSEITRLLTCEALQLAEFADALTTALESREAVLLDQEVLAEAIGNWNSAEAFAASIKLALPARAGRTAVDRQAAARG